MDTELDPIARLALAPSRAYRELMYRPHGATAQWIADRFDIVARPGQQITDRPRQGDVLLRVSLGHPNAGVCAVIDQPDNGQRRMAPGQLLLRRRAIREGPPPIEHDFGDEADAETRTPVVVDTAAAVPAFEMNERSRIAQPLLTPRASASAVEWTSREHPAISGVTVDEIRAALACYTDATAVRSAIQARNQQDPAQAVDASSPTTDAVFVECVHQFQMKCYLESREHNGRAVESTLDSLGLIARQGSGLRTADRGHATAQQRLNSRDTRVKTASAQEFSAANWFNLMTDPSVFGRRTKGERGLHVALVRKLRRAERHLITLPAFRGMTPAALGTALGLSEKHGGARRDATTSVHTFGLAIDIGYLRNPWVRSSESWEAMRRAAYLISGVNLTHHSAQAYFSSLGSDPSRSTGEIWDEIQERNAELIAYLGFAADPQALRAALTAGQARGTPGLINQGENLVAAAARWQRDIDQDRQALAASDFKGRQPERGFLTHPRDLAIALRDHACLAWGAVDLGDGDRGSGDMMHYDARIDGVGRALTQGTRAFLPTAGHPCLNSTASGAAEVAESDAETIPEQVHHDGLDAETVEVEAFGEGATSPAMANPRQSSPNMTEQAPTKVGDAALFAKLRSRAPGDRQEMRKTLSARFASSPDDLWLAETLLDNGPEPRWPAALIKERTRRQAASGYAGNALLWMPGGIQADLPYPKEAKADKDNCVPPVTAYFFAGATSERALIIGGVHGSEPQGARVADEVRKDLTTAAAAGRLPQYTTIVIPVLHERTHATGQRNLPRRKGEEPQAKPARTKKKAGRIEPNRTFPAPGETYQDIRAREKAGRPGLEYKGRQPRPNWQLSTSVMPPETRVLVQLIERFKPSRIVSVHAHSIGKKNKETGKWEPRPGDDPGIFVDPVKGKEEAGDKLAEDMIAAGKRKRRTLPSSVHSGRGDPFYGNVGATTRYSTGAAKVPGYSLGDWAPSTGAQTITVEIPQYVTSCVPVGQRARQAVETMHKEILLECFLELPRPTTRPAGTKGSAPRQPAPVQRSGASEVSNATGAAAPAVKRYTLERGVKLTADIEAKVAKIADAFYAEHPKNIVITSGTRSPASQASAMYRKLVLGADIVAEYRDKKTVREVKKAYDDSTAAKKPKAEVIAAMADIIKEQVAAGTYISKHLRAGAVDVRSRTMSAEEKKSFRKAAESVASKVILEKKPPHWHLQF